MEKGQGKSPFTNAKEAKKLERNKASAKLELARARRNNNVRELPAGVRNFRLKYVI